MRAGSANPVLLDVAGGYEPFADWLVDAGAWGLLYVVRPRLDPWFRPDWKPALRPQRLWLERDRFGSVVARHPLQWAWHDSGHGLVSSRELLVTVREPGGPVAVILPFGSRMRAVRGVFSVQFPEPLLLSPAAERAQWWAMTPEGEPRG